VNNIDFAQIMEKGIAITSSGTSGEPKSYFQSPAKLRAANKVAREAQQITSSSKVYTCCKITHAGGLLAQTLPAMEIGAEVDIVQFSAYDFVKKISQYTHTHITPLHAKAIMMTKGFQTLDLTGVWVTCGADPVQWNIIEAFVERGATFLVNWGMSEVGPIAIGTRFNTLEKVQAYKQLCPVDATILGDVSYCNFKLVDQELHVAGEICIYDGWYATKDRVIVNDGVLFYQGRTNKEVDLWTSKKG
jgi:acyl-CoA synthetase (AMP-forming)/AMP-acid ligase II